jgi:hypothetical protein
MPLTEQKKLNWIPNNQIINRASVRTNIVGSVFFDNKEDEKKENIIFLNSYQHEDFSPIFEFELRTDNDFILFYPKVCSGPSYLANPFQKMGEFWGLKKLKNYLLVGLKTPNDGNKIIVWNEKTSNMCLITFNEKVIDEEENLCGKENCTCYDEINKDGPRQILPNLPRYSLNYQKQKEEDTLPFGYKLLDLLDLDYNDQLLDFDICEESNVIFFLYQKNYETKIAFFFYENKTNKIVLDQNRGPYLFEYCFKYPKQLLFRDNYLYVTTSNTVDGSNTIKRIKWFPTFGYLSYNYQDFETLQICPTSISNTRFNILLTYQCFGNSFGIKYIKMDTPPYLQNK